MKVVASQYVTLFIVNGVARMPSAQDGQETVFRSAREALDEAYAHGWQPFETVALGIGRTADTNEPQVELVIHLVKYEDEVVPVKASLKKDA